MTGGGTGGHVTPALATIEAIKSMATQSDVQPIFRYIGSSSGVEKRLATTAGIEFVGIQTGKLRRATKWTGLFSFKNISDAFRIPVGVIQALWQVARFRPDVIFSTGGFVCVPPVIAGWLLGIPILTHEQTVQIGLANQIAARFARRIALSFEGAINELPKRLQAKAFVSGNPIRPLIFEGDKNRAREFCGFVASDDHLPTVYITGGAQGARVINQAVEAALADLLKLCRIIHQCGQQPAGDEQDFDRLQKVVTTLPSHLKHRYYLTRFVNEEIGDVYALADLVVSRAGAGTVTEISALAKPAIFVPLVPTGGDEQTRNARRSEQAGAAVIISQATLSGETLLTVLQTLLSKPKLLQTMGQAAQTLARPNASHDLAQTVIELAKR